MSHFIEDLRFAKNEICKTNNSNFWLNDMRFVREICPSLGLASLKSMILRFSYQLTQVVPKKRQNWVLLL